jgi:Transposase and inactivated derivatives
MPTVGFRFRAYIDERTLRALKAQLKLACEIYNTLRWADIYFYQDGKGLTQTELRQLALDLRKQDERYRQLYSQVVQQIADRYYEARQRFFEGLARFPKESTQVVLPRIPSIRLESPEGKGDQEEKQ